MAASRFQEALQWVKLWTETHPELKDRLERAVFLLDHVESTLSPVVYRVRSETSRRVYLVRVNRKTRTSTCTCPDSQKGNHCKHRLAVALLEKISRGAQPGRNCGTRRGSA